MKAFAVISLAAYTSARDDIFQTNIYQSSLPTAVNQMSNNVNANNTRKSTYLTILGFSTCTCDLTVGGCDFACCCDQDCPVSAVNLWQLQNVCLNENLDYQLLNYDECVSKNDAPIIEDLQGGMTFFYKSYRKLLCTN